MGIERCTEAEEELIHGRLREYNTRFLTDWESLSFLIRGEGSEILAGIVASRELDCVTLEYFHVEEAHRGKGLGRLLLARVEEEARAKGAKRIALNTFSFQAPGFYEKHGYTLAGKVEPCFGPYGQYFYKKEL